MKCPNCGNQKFDRLDYSVVRSTKCYSLFDPHIYPGFSEPNVEVGEEWDTTEDDSDDWEDDA